MHSTREIVRGKRKGTQDKGRNREEGDFGLDGTDRGEDWRMENE